MECSGTAKPTGSQWTRLNGFTGGTIRESKSYDPLNNLTDATTTLDRTNHLVTDTTTYPGSSNAVQVSHAGWLGSSQSQTGVTTWFTYDPLGRRTLVTDGRGDETETSYDASGRVAWVEDGADNHAAYGYYTPADAGTQGWPGRLKSVENPAGNHTYYGYNERGQTDRVWGDVPQPSLTVYGEYGQRTSLTTYRDDQIDWTDDTWPSPTGGDVTTWAYDDATGLLNTKTDADSKAVTYTYTDEGRLDTRHWARHDANNVTTYAYDAYTGELTDVTYPSGWGMTDLNYAYDRLGRRTSVTDAAGERTFTYHADSFQLTKEGFTSGLFNGKIIAQGYEGTGGTLPGRFNGLYVGTSQVVNSYYGATYKYDAVGRLHCVTGPGLPTGMGSDYGAEYTYVSGSDLVQEVQFRNDSTLLVKSVHAYEEHRDLLASVENIWRPNAQTPATLSQYAYTNDNLARRTGIDYSGVAFGSPDPAIGQTLGYNERNELSSSARDDEADLERAYTYDPIGNRTTYTMAGTDEATYVSNKLNQYERADRPSGTVLRERYTYDLDGNLAESYVTGDMNCDGVADYADVDLFLEALGEDEATWNENHPDCPYLNADLNGDGTVDFRDIDPFVALLGSTNTSAARTYAWDGENRLACVQPTDGTEQDGQTRVTFAYDYQGRRVWKQVETYSGTYPSGSWDVTAVSKFLWDGWKLLLELDGSNNILRKYTYGLDLAGQSGGSTSGRSMLESAGTIGGLLAVEQRRVGGSPLKYVYLYDGNGNVGQVVDLSAGSAGAALKVKYEYDPYGARTNTPAEGEYDQPLRFSTKYFDAETGFLYFGGRYYQPSLGRWLNRDPIGEDGGENLYEYAANDPIDRFDPLGYVCGPRPEDCGGGGGGGGGHVAEQFAPVFQGPVAGHDGRTHLVTPQALIELRKQGAMSELRRIIREGISEIDQAAAGRLAAVSEKVSRNLEAALGRHIDEVRRLRRRRAKFFGFEVAPFVGAAAIRILAAVALHRIAGPLVAGVQIAGVSNARELWKRAREHVKEHQQASRTPAAILYRHARSAQRAARRRPGKRT